MDFITKLGKVSFQIKKLSDKVTELSKATLNIKALGPKLNNVIENQEDLKREIKILKSLTYKNSSGEAQKSVLNEEKEEEPSKKDSAIAKIKELKSEVRSIEDYQTLIEKLTALRETLFDYTGGSKILYQLSQITKELKEKRNITSKIIEDIRQKADEWITTLQSE